MLPVPTTRENASVQSGGSLAPSLTDFYGAFIRAFPLKLLKVCEIGSALLVGMMI